MNFANATANVDLLTAALQTTKLSGTGVTFAGKSLKLDTVNDAKPIVEKIKECKHLEYLNLEGNTMGVEASKSIAEALEKHPEFKKALWKDMFTGRLKTEIPKSLGQVELSEDFLLDVLKATSESHFDYSQFVQMNTFPKI